MIPLLTYFAAACDSAQNFFALPTWYKYLQSAGYLKYSDVSNSCEVQIEAAQFDFHVFTLIGLGVLDIMIRVAGLVAVGFVIFGATQYITSKGEPDKAKKALGTIINALVGLAIAVVAAAAVSFIGSEISS